MSVTIPPVTLVYVVVRWAGGMAAIIAQISLAARERKVSSLLLLAEKNRNQNIRILLGFGIVFVVPLLMEEPFVHD